MRSYVLPWEGKISFSDEELEELRKLQGDLHGTNKTVSVSGNIPKPFYEELKLVHDAFGMSWGEPLTNAVLGGLQCMESHILEDETRDMRYSAVEKIRASLKAGDSKD